MFDKYTNHSGGANGSDFAWDVIGREYGFNNHIHYYHGNITPYGNTQLSHKDICEGIIHAKKAAKVLGRSWNDRHANLLGRNWFQVKNSTRILAIGNLIKPACLTFRGYQSKAKKIIVDGGTGYAVEMAIANNKEVYVFDLNTNHWFKWCGVIYRECDIPVLAFNYAGIGTRNITEAGVLAIIKVYEETIELES